MSMSMIPKRITAIFAHRGSSATHPENTMAAFREAYRTGADGIELDVHLSKDGIPVVIHDEQIDRTSDGTGWVKDYTLQQLKRFDFGSPFSGRFRGERIPALREVLEWCRSKPILLNIELKTDEIRYPGIEWKVVSLIQQYQMDQRVILSSFNHDSLIEARRIHPVIETAALFAEWLYKPWEYARSIGADGLHFHWLAASPELLHGAAQAGMPVRLYTVNDELKMRYFIRSGYAGIFTDWPEKAMKVRAKAFV